MKNLRKRNYIVIACIIALILLFGVWLIGGVTVQEKEHAIDLITESKTTHDVSVVFINAGKADSMLLQLDGRSFLIDTGKKKSAKTIKKVLNKYGVKELEAVFLSHEHKDHVGGIYKIAESYSINKMYTADLVRKNYADKSEIDRIGQEIKVPVQGVSFGDRIELVDDVYFEVLGPIVYNKNSENDCSLVLRLYVNGKVFLFTGDMQIAEEKTLLDKGVDVSADIYKVSNHGNPDATIEEFAKKVSPSYAVVTTDTSVDTDSANPKVLSYFADAEIYLTQEYNLGILFTVDREGRITVSEA